jgi:hypothetical protein
MTAILRGIMRQVMTRFSAAKVNDDLATRVAKLGASTRLQVLLQLTGQPTFEPGGRRLSPEERKTRIAAIRARADSSLREVERILTLYGGRRLDARPDALGYLLVEATPAAIASLAVCGQVAAILENQRVSLLQALAS